MYEGRAASAPGSPCTLRAESRENIFMMKLDEGVSLQVPEYFGALALVHRTLRTTWDRRLKTKRLIAVGTVNMSLEEILSMRGHSHATVEPLHMTQFHCVQRFFFTREGRVNFFLEALVCLRIEQEVIDEGGEDTTCCV